MPSGKLASQPNRFAEPSSLSHPSAGTDSAWRSSYDAGVQDYLQGHYLQAESAFGSGLQIAEVFGSHDPRFATSLNNLAEVLRALGKYSDAEPLYRQALDIRTAAFGRDHPHVAVSLNNLGVLLLQLARPDEAEPHIQRALA